jgi:type IV pilus assembly protein PilA
MRSHRWMPILSYLSTGEIMKRVQQGFTLIELMIVVAIVGILAAIALPAYQDYVVRSKMSETEAALAACKTSVSEYVSTHSNYPSDIGAAGCGATDTQYVKGSSATVGACLINYVSQNTGAGSGSECTLTLVADNYANGQASISQWKGSFTGCSSKYVPSAFRP